MDHVAFMAAFERVAKRLVQPPFNFAATGNRYMAIPFIRERKYGDLPDTIDELIEDNLDDDAIANFVTLLVLCEMTPKGAPRREPGDLHIPRGEFRCFDGDLIVNGNFGYECAVLVRGDLLVDGLIEDRFECAPLLVGGNVRARGMYIGSQTKIAGSLELAELLHLRFTRGGDTLFVAGGATTKLYVWTPDDSTLAGGLAATYRVEAYPEPDDAAFAALLPHLTPALAKALATDEPAMTLLVDAVRKRTPIWLAPAS